MAHAILERPKHQQRPDRHAQGPDRGLGGGAHRGRNRSTRDRQAAQRPHVAIGGGTGPGQIRRRGLYPCQRFDFRDRFRTDLTPNRRPDETGQLSDQSHIVARSGCRDHPNGRDRMDHDLGQCSLRNRDCQTQSQCRHAVALSGDRVGFGGARALLVGTIHRLCPLAFCRGCRAGRDRVYCLAVANHRPRSGACGHFRRGSGVRAFGPAWRAFVQCGDRCWPVLFHFALGRRAYVVCGRA